MRFVKEDEGDISPLPKFWIIINDVLGGDSNANAVPFF